MNWRSGYTSAPMAAIDVKLAEGIPDLAALGAREAADLLGTGAPLEDEARIETISSDAGAKLLRYPLPGTPGPEARSNGLPIAAVAEAFQVDLLGLIQIVQGFMHARSAELGFNRDRTAAMAVFHLAEVVQGLDDGAAQLVAAGLEQGRLGHQG